MIKIGFVVVDLAPYHIARFLACRRFGEIYIIDGGSEVSVGYNSPQVKGLSIKGTTLKKLPKVLESIAPDVLVVPGWASPISRKATLWAIRENCPVIVLSDSQLYGYVGNVIIDLLKRVLIGVYSAAVVAGSRHHQYMQHFGMPVECIYNGVDVVDNEHFARGAAIAKEDSFNIRKILQLPDQYILLVNRLVEQKNIPGLLLAYKTYLSNRSGFVMKLVIAGGGPLKSDLLHLVEELDLQESVHFKGPIQYDELPKYYGLADLFILNSNSETWGLVVNEAMAAGLPVLVSKQCGCSPDLVRHEENGFVYDSNDPDELASYLSGFSDHMYDLERMCAASRRIISKWSPEFFAENMYNAAIFVCSQPRRVPLVSRILLTLLCLVDWVKGRR